MPDTPEALARDLIIAALPGLVVDSATEALFRDGCAGGVCLYGRNIRHPAQVRGLTDTIRALAGQDTLVTCDLEGGYVWRLRPPATHWPSAMAFGASGRPDLTRIGATMAAREFRAMGIDAPFAPVADVSDHPGNPVIGTRAFGGSAPMVTRHVTAAIGGYREGGVASCAKHFPGHGHTDIDSHHALPVLTHTLDRLESIEFVPFVGAIRAGVDMVMVSHLLVQAIDPDVPASLSRTVTTDLLRGRLGFRGVIVTDALDMGAITDTYGIPEAAVRAIAAGCDLVTFNASVAICREVHGAVTAAIVGGRLPRDQVVASRDRIVAMRRSLARNPRPPLTIVGDPTHRALADTVASLAITGTPGPGMAPTDRVLVIEFDPRLPFTDPNVHAPPTRIGAAIGAIVHETTDYCAHPNDWANDHAQLIATARATTHVVVVTRNAWRTDNQRQALLALRAVRPDLHLVAVRDPQDCAVIANDGPRLHTYADDASSVQAIVGILLSGAPVTGTLPVALS